MKTRFCPSPTGFVHLGNVRTALFNALLANKEKGTFLLRIEDTDKLRSDEKYTKHLIEDLHWLGLDWQEGPEIGGEYGPYWQSERQELYDAYYQKLIDEKRAYPCFCSEQHLAIMRKIQLSSGKPPRYDGSCRKLTEEEIKAKLAAGHVPTLRFAVPEKCIVEFEDLVKGQQRFQQYDMGDFIIRRADGTPPFMFCNAVDDALMKVSHVLRGEDHLANTPRQILILQALNLPIPRYGHFSLIMAEDGGKLSKRLGSISIQELRIQGYLPLAIGNYLARLGHHYENQHLMSFEELAQNFNLNLLSGAQARLDLQHLHHWQKLAVAQADDETLWQWFGPEVVHDVPDTYKNIFIRAIRPNCIFPQDGRHWAQRFFAKELMYTEADIIIFRQASEKFFNEAIKAVEAHGSQVQKIYQHLTLSCNVKGKTLYQPLRAALTGTLEGPELGIIFEILGIERIKQRFISAMRMV
jgi:glutamyl-tRNA synthetase